jgi:hypothetical protein
MNIPDEIEGIRFSLCETCASKCQSYKDRLIEYASPLAACPDGRWREYITNENQSASNTAPNLVAKVENLTKAFLRWREAGYPTRTKEQRRACLAVCASCSYYRAKGNFHLGECGHPRCGCTDFKPFWATETCPVGKWPKFEK